MPVALPAGRGRHAALRGGAKRCGGPRGVTWRRKQGRREQFPDGRGRAGKPIGATARRHSGWWMTHGSVFSCVLICFVIRLVLLPARIERQVCQSGANACFTRVVGQRCAGWPTSSRAGGRNRLRRCYRKRTADRVGRSAMKRPRPACGAERVSHRGRKWGADGPRWVPGWERGNLRGAKHTQVSAFRCRTAMLGEDARLSMPPESWAPIARASGCITETVGRPQKRVRRGTSEYAPVCRRSVPSRGAALAWRGLRARGAGSGGRRGICRAASRHRFGPRSGLLVAFAARQQGQAKYQARHQSDRDAGPASAGGPAVQGMDQVGLLFGPDQRVHGACPARAVRHVWPDQL